jgi:hypothetical protein
MSTNRDWILILGGLVAAFAVLAVLGEVFGAGPQGPASSTYATSSPGLAAAAELLQRNAHRVTPLRRPLASAAVDPRATLLVLDPDALLRADGRRLLAFVRSGGRLVLGGVTPSSWLPAVMPNAPAWTDVAPRSYTAAGPLAALGGPVITAGAGAWTESGGLQVAIGAPGGGLPALALYQRLGRGELFLLADASPLQNRLLARGADAQLALFLAGPGRPVFAAESVHGYGVSRGLGAVPGRWWLTLGGLAAAGLVWVLARGRRLGPPDVAPQRPAPARREYVEAMALLLRRSKREAEVAELLRARARHELRRRGATRTVSEDGGLLTAATELSRIRGSR